MSKSTRHQEEEKEENAERWLLTYADLITLLLIFFIIMYTMAKMDVAKFNVMAESLSGAFKGTKSINVGSEGILKDLPPVPKDLGAGAEQKAMDSLEGKINNLAKKYNLQDYIKVTQEERGLDVEIKNELVNIVLFQSGSAELTPEATDIISKIGTLLTELPDNYMRIEGHTDNIPISTKAFKSNWDLSTSRSTNVINLLINKAGLDPTKLSAVGYGEYKPLADNNTEDGRAKNRRVNIVIIKTKYNVVEQKQ